MIYVLTFSKDFGRDSKYFPRDEQEWVIYGSPNKAEVISRAKIANQNPLLNLTTERFRVWEGKKAKFQKANSRLVFDGFNEL